MFFSKNLIYESLKCINCKQRLDEPRLLPCGETICSRCLSLINLTEHNFICFVCTKEHVMPVNGLPVNKLALNFYTLQPIQFSRGADADKLRNLIDKAKKKKDYIR